ncbi:MAG TPA: hypothetical protein PLR20_12900 [Syntrophales bacterium]|nr:hypothetical protein [Syntrophales bacterium]
MGFTKTCVVCGRATWMLNDKDECEWCTRKDDVSAAPKKPASSTETMRDQPR